MALVSKPTPSNINALIIPFYDQAKTIIPDSLSSELKLKLKPLVTSHVTGKAGEIELLHTENNRKHLLIALVNLGKKKDINLIKLKELGGKINGLIKKYKASKVAIASHKTSITGQDLSAIAMGMDLSSYKFDQFLTNKKNKQHQYDEIQLICPLKSINKSELEETNAIISGTNYTRNLVNMPPNHMTPSQLSKEAKTIAKMASGKIKLTIFDEKKLKKLGMGLILGVGEGSHQESQMIFLEYKNKPTNKKPLIVVGKGITFDAGGLNLKPTNSIEDMKSDMAGAASVLGIMKIIATLKPNLHIIGVISSAENLLGEKAMKPGDILKAYNGKTVEITNTDAEGRLVLADALAYITEKYDPEFVLDMATLTGACIVALGYELTGVVTNKNDLFAKLEAASKASGEQFWQLPLTDLFRKKVKSEIADYKNWTAGVNAGSSMGAAFLEKFINKKPWLHLDIAGTSWTPSSTPLTAQGATGQPVHTIWQLLKSYEEIRDKR